MQNIRHTVTWMMTVSTPDLTWNWRRQLCDKEGWELVKKPINWDSKRYGTEFWLHRLHLERIFTMNEEKMTTHSPYRM